MKKIFIKNRKDENLAVIVENGGHKKGLVFIMHGLGATKDDVHISFFRKVFYENDLTVVSFDARNTNGESDGNIYEATVTNYYEDLEDVISWSKGELWYEGPFWLVGHSLGSLCTAHYAALHPGEVKALVPTSVATSPKKIREEMSQKDIDEWAREGILFGPSTVDIGGKMNRVFKDDAEKYDLFKEVDLLKMPVALMVGDRDKITRPEHHQEFYEKLSGEKELHIIQGAGHVFCRESEFLQIEEILKDFINKVG